MEYRCFDSAGHHWRAPVGALERGEGLLGHNSDRERESRKFWTMRCAKFKSEVNVKKVFLTYFVFVDFRQGKKKDITCTKRTMLRRERGTTGCVQTMEMEVT